ncbi:MAG: hypothetical protein KA715_05595 [Xanthomonadaceae bacterium]|nr:hypothetical protein [Xanthomonadaceae bacterium]
MGRKIRSQKISTLVLAFFALVSIEAHAGVSWLQSTVTDATPLLTDRVLDFDQDILNPHRTRVAFKRYIQVNGLAAIPYPTGSGFSVSVVGIDSHVLIGARAPSSPLFSPIEEFPCSLQPDERFAMYEPTIARSQKKADRWHAMVKQSLPKIEFALQSIREPVEKMAIARAEIIVNSWTKRLQTEWTEWNNNDSRADEWKHYQLAAAKLAEPCKYKKRGFRPWAEIMDPVPESPKVTEPLARSPARRVGQGEWTLRVNAQALYTKINGQFLLDPSSSMSVISPDWLEAQGVEHYLLEDPGKRTVHVQRRNRENLTKILLLSHFESSGQQLGLDEFALLNVDEFKTPEDFDICCDGVLGLDFLRKNVIQLDSSAPLGGVLIWPRSNYRAPTGFRWNELGIEPDGSLPKKITAEIRSNTPMIIDLPHGRVWYPPSETAKKKPKYSGLKLKYVMEKGSRVLKVISIDPKSKAEALRKFGITEKMNLARIGDFTARYLNQWTVDEMLKGVWGDEIVIEYRDSKDQNQKATLKL